MYEKLDKLREELQKAKKKKEEAERKVRQMEQKLREAENAQILSDVTALHLTPEQLAEFLKKMTTGETIPFFKGKEETHNNYEDVLESEDEEDEM